MDRDTRRRDETRCFAMLNRTVRCYHNQIPGEDFCGGHIKDPSRFNLRAYRKALKEHDPGMFVLQPRYMRPKIVLGR